MRHQLLSFLLKCYQSLVKTVLRFIKVEWPVLFQGPDSSLELLDYISRKGVNRLLIVSDKVLNELGLLDEITSHCGRLGIEFFVFDRIFPDPTVEQINDGFAELKDRQCDAILCVGGGSPIDAAKVIAAMATSGKSAEQLEGLFNVPCKPMPFFVIPTTAGTGSEVSFAAAISDPENKRKFPVFDPKLIAAAVALDCKMMASMPASITAATGMDALTHAIEAYISRNATRETDRFAAEAAASIFKHLPTAYVDGADKKTRQEMAWASYQAGRAFTLAGVGNVHAIAHNLGGHYHTPHGVANAMVLPHVLEVCFMECYQRLAELADITGTGSHEFTPQEKSKGFHSPYHYTKQRTRYSSYSRFTRCRRHSCNREGGNHRSQENLCGAKISPRYGMRKPAEEFAKLSAFFRNH